ncbi:hypothetical protein L1049_025193 [Liquidambar formosana]|uniref:DDE Tnp4 domain-containing protein n=1 Tax=Liquidambar formosana TaxID=63359 RepID=A0AAP0RVU9_LIQFO
MDPIYEDNEEDIIDVAALVVVSAAWATAIEVIQRTHLHICRQPQVNRDDVRIKYLNGLIRENNIATHNLLRMNQNAFFKLCIALKTKGLRNTSNVDVEEQVAMFLYILGHNLRLRVIANNFSRSLDTVHRHFLNVLKAVVKLYKDLVKPPGINSSPEIGSNFRTWHNYFKDCVGAIDGSYIPAMVPLEDQPRYRTRKGRIAQNVMAVVGFDMKFTYVLAGWEGSARDSKVLQSSLRNRQDKLVVPTGKYYLVDAGYPNSLGFLAPYRGVHYHRNERRGHAPVNAKELFNYRHSSLRNIIERSFGLIKKRWAILRTEPFFDIKVQVKIVIACCTLHNFILNVDPDDLLEHELNDASEDLGSDQVILEEDVANLATSLEWSGRRDALATLMWNEYNR